MSQAVLSAGQARALDLRTIASGVPSLSLMELAGVAASACLRESFGGPVTLVCGRGNNGGDGWVMARHLHRRGLKVRVLELQGERSADCQLMRAAALAQGVCITQSLEGAGVIVDALFGTGLRAGIIGPAVDLVRAINAHPAPVLAVDLPSGVLGDDGRVLGPVVLASRTISLGPPRLGHFLETVGAVGVLEIAEIGLAPAQEFSARIPQAADIAALFAPRGRREHKGSRGRLAVVAGSLEMAGAAALCCMGALGAGCGLVTLHLPQGALPALRELPVEVMLRTDMDLDYADAVVLGPGLGRARGAVLSALWGGLDKPAVFDADALAALGERPAPSPYPRVITPHAAEAARLLGWTTARVLAERWLAAQELRTISAVLLKGPHTLCVGEQVQINLPGGPELAVGGSGDVLAGFLGALLARGLSVDAAMSAAAFVHGLAGRRLGPQLRASQLALELPAALASLGQLGPLLPHRTLI